MMRTTATLGLVLLLGGIAAPALPRAQSRADVALREAIETETVKGDLRKALEQYRKLADGKDRSVAAQALLRMARVYELLRSPEARKTYERIVAQFFDQKDAADKARAQLRAASSKPAGLAQLRVWAVSEIGAAAEGSVSSDGKYICFTTDLKDRSYLAVHDVANGTDRVLTNAPKADSGEGCSFSPSGDQIAYAWHALDSAPDWELRVVSIAENAVPRTLLHDTSRWFATPAWSPDGRSIAVQAVRGNERDGQSETILVAVQDRTTRVLPTPGSWRMFFSPDGRHLALDRWPSGSTGHRDVFVLPIDGAQDINVTDSPGDDRIMGWSPDSSHLLFSSDRSGRTGLYAVPIPAGNRPGSPTLLKAELGDLAPMGVTRAGELFYHARSGGAVSFLQTVACNATAARCSGAPVTLGPATRMAFAWSPDSGYLAYLSPSTRSNEGPTLRLRSAEGTSVREVSPTDLPLGGSVDMSWSSDGRTVAVATLRGGRLSLVNVEGQRAEVTWSGRIEQGAITGLAWSADRRKLYYRLNLIGTNRGAALVERDLASHSERELLRRTPRGIGGWSLSPDGQSVWVFVTDSGAEASDLLAVPVAGGEPRVIARALATAGGMNVSPDGRYVATASRVAGTKDTAVVLIPTDGSEPRELIRVTEPSQVGNVIWARDSRTVYFRRRSNTANPRAELWQLGIDATAPRRVEDAPELEMAWPVALSPDGRQLAFIRGDGGGQPRSEVWKLENFLPGGAK